MEQANPLFLRKKIKGLTTVKKYISLSFLLDTFYFKIYINLPKQQDYIESKFTFKSILPVVKEALDRLVWNHLEQTTGVLSNY